jgi:hypothetical protein
LAAIRGEREVHRMRFKVLLVLYAAVALARRSGPHRVCVYWEGVEERPGATEEE